MLIAAGLAALASVLEAIQGDVCPLAFNDTVPMCYISLGFTVVIGVLFWLQGRSTVAQPANLAD